LAKTELNGNKPILEFNDTLCGHLMATGYNKRKWKPTATK